MDKDKMLMSRGSGCLSGSFPVGAPRRAKGGLEEKRRGGKPHIDTQNRTQPRANNGGGRRRDRNQQQRQDSLQNDTQNSKDDASYASGTYHSSPSPDYQSHYDPLLKLYGSKGKNVDLSDCLGFTTYRRQASEYYGRQHRSGNFGGRRRSSFDFKQAPKQSSLCSVNGTNTFNKERYLLAMCKFVVSNELDCKEKFHDPDFIVDWEKIEELRVISTNEINCPICLYPPISAKITRCGHIFCWPCILHYLALSDRKWRKCPICYDAIYPSELKSVVIHQIDDLKIGELATFNQFQYHKGHAPHLTQGNQESELTTQRFIEYSSSDIQEKILARERLELEIKLETDSGEPESCFILQALENLAIREVDLEGSGDERKQLAKVSSAPLVVESKERHLKIVCEDAFNDVLVEQEVSANDYIPRESEKVHISEPPVVDSSPDNNGIASKSSDKLYIFYQVANGQPVFLHPINIRCIAEEYGELGLAPKTISGKVLQLDRFVITAEIRKKYKFLAHLPLASNAVFAEIELGTEFVSAATLSRFSKVLSSRERMRQRKCQEERRLENNAKNWEKLVMNPEVYKSTENWKNNNPEDLPVVTYIQSAQIEIGSSVATNAATNETGAEMDDDLPHIPSFADMLRKKAKEGEERPDAGRAATETPTSVHPTNEADDDATPALPSYSDAFASALDQLDKRLANHSESATVPHNHSKGKKKGKNPKNTVLFSI